MAGSPTGWAGRAPPAPWAAPAPPIRCRSSCRATGSCPGRAASAATRAVRTASARCSRSRLGLGDLHRLDHDRVDGLLVRADRADADQVDDVLALGDLADEGVLRRELRVLAGDDEELAAR